MRTGKIHAARLETSPRLRAVLEALRESPAGLTTRQVIQKTGMCAINSIIDELRENGVRIDGEWVSKSLDGSRAFLYRLTPAEPVQGDLFRPKSA